MSASAAKEEPCNAQMSRKAHDKKAHERENGGDLILDIYSATAAALPAQTFTNVEHLTVLTVVILSVRSCRRT